MMQLNSMQDTISARALVVVSGSLLPSPAGIWHGESRSVLQQIPLISSYHLAGKNSNNLSSSRTAFTGERYDGKPVITTSILLNVVISRPEINKFYCADEVLIIGNFLFRRSSETRKVIKAQRRSRHGHGVVSVLKVSPMLLLLAHEG